MTTETTKLAAGELVSVRLEDDSVHEFTVEFQDDAGAVKISRWITRDRVFGQTVSEVPGKPGRVITGRPQNVKIHNPTNEDPFALIPGAYSDPWED
jgi:hypothetical protein